MKNKLIYLIFALPLSIHGVPQNRELGSGNAGTHMTPLITCIMNTEGPILEMGAGDYSTPLLHAICSKSERPLCTVESDSQWLNFFTDLETSWHKFIFVKNERWDLTGNDIHWSVVLIDHKPAEQRRVDIQRLRNNVDIFVAHDSQAPLYQYEKVFATFKYRYTYTRYRVETTIVSDTIDVAKFFENN